MKKSLSFVFAMIMLVMCFIPAIAADTKATSGNFTYEVVDGEVIITGYVEEPVGELVIPEVIDGRPVTKLGDNAFRECKQITKVTMPSVKVLGKEAFMDCSSIAEIDLSMVDELGPYSLARCSSLVSLDMPVARYMKFYALTECTSLKEVYMPNLLEIGAAAFSWDTSLEQLISFNVEGIDEYAFKYCENFKTFTFYNDAPEQFGYQAFYGCHPDFTIWYAREADNWETPVWNDTPAFPFGLPTGLFYVTFIDGLTNSYMTRRIVESGKGIITPEPAVHEGYTFLYWDGNYTEVYQNEKVYSIYELTDAPTPTPTEKPTPTPTEEPTPTQEPVTHTVTFVEPVGNTTIAEVTVEEGKAATAPDLKEMDAFKDQIFVGWDKDFSNVTEDMTVTAETWLIGDTNMDGVVNTADATVLLKYAAGAVQFNDRQTLVADTNLDKIVNTGDATLLLKYCAGSVLHFTNDWE